MKEALKQMLRETAPRSFGASIMVTNVALGDGCDAFFRLIRSHLSQKLADFIVDNKVLDGADKSGFLMTPRVDLDATECRSQLHVLTPNELHSLLDRAFEIGAQEGFLSAPSMRTPSLPYPSMNVPKKKKGTK